MQSGHDKPAGDRSLQPRHERAAEALALEEELAGALHTLRVLLREIALSEGNRTLADDLEAKLNASLAHSRQLQRQVFDLEDGGPGRRARYQVGSAPE